jgi:glycosyltransferase involved in cell wall biosynthesis
MSRERVPVVLVGVFPPPMHGMAAVNAAVREALQQAGMEPRAINLAAPSLDRSMAARLARLPRVLRGLAVLISARRLGGGTLYMSVSGGPGQLYELAFIMLARLRGMRLFLHHHSFAYLDRPSQLTAWLARVAGTDAVHVTQSPRMAGQLKALYGVRRAVPISNAVFLLSHKDPLDESRRRLRTIGFISNIAAEKGVFEFLDLIAAAQRVGLPLSAILAGPFQDAETERLVRAQLLRLPSVDYVGPKYGAEKEAFFSDIDVLVFPTRYVNETEGIVNHEAMSRGIPVIAYGRGCIPEIVSRDCGKVIDPAEPFVPAALAQIEAWLDDPAGFEAASRAAAKRFAETYAQNERRWRMLLSDLTCSLDAHAHPRAVETGD